MAKEVGLYIITTKTKLIICNIPHSSLQLEGEDIENLKDFNISICTFHRAGKTSSAGKEKY